MASKIEDYALLSNMRSGPLVSRHGSVDWWCVPRFDSPALFAALLAGRKWQGWRGKTALRFTLAGFATLALAYVGSRFVLEVVLHRGVY